MSKPARAVVVVSLVLTVAGIGLGAFTLGFELGWAAWIASLAAVALGIILALSATKRALVLGVLVAAAVVVVGVVAVRIQPPLLAGWVELPRTTPGTDDNDDQDSAVGRDDHVAVYLNDDDDLMRGVDVSNGKELWTLNNASGGGDKNAVYAGDIVIMYPAGGGEGETTRAVKTSTGKLLWSIDAGGTRPFTANDDVVVLTDGKVTTAVSRQTGETIWNRPLIPVASSEGSASFAPQRWTQTNDWIVVQNPTDTGGTYRVVDARTGKEAAKFHGEHGNFAIVADTLVTFDYNDKQRRIAIGTPITGGQGWTTEIQRWGVNGFYEPFGSEVRIVGESFIQTIDVTTGKTPMHELPFGWSFDRIYFGVDGARYLVANLFDAERNIEATAVVDSVTGKLTKLKGRGATDGARVDGATPNGTLIFMTVRDAVGGEKHPLILVPNPDA